MRIRAFASQSFDWFALSVSMCQESYIIVLGISRIPVTEGLMEPVLKRKTLIYRTLGKQRTMSFIAENPERHGQTENGLISHPRLATYGVDCMEGHPSNPALLSVERLYSMESCRELSIFDLRRVLHEISRGVESWSGF